MVGYFLSGTVAVRVDGATVALGGPKQRCVLAALLAEHDTVVSIDRLIDAVWDGVPPAKALASLRSYIANLRRILNEAPAPDRGEVQRLESRRVRLPAEPARRRFTGPAPLRSPGVGGSRRVEPQRSRQRRRDARPRPWRCGAEIPSGSSPIAISPRPTSSGCPRCGQPQSRLASMRHCNSAAAAIWCQRSRPQ